MPESDPFQVLRERIDDLVKVVADINIRIVRIEESVKNSLWMKSLIVVGIASTVSGIVAGWVVALLVK